MDRRKFLKGVAGAAAVAATSRGIPAAAEASDRFTLAAVGDCILTRRVSGIQDPDFLALVDLLRGADCAWGNCEVVIADPRQVFPMPKGPDPHASAPPWAADELAWAGVRFMGTANNHTLDFGYDGLRSTLDNLERAGIANAGSGPDLALAAKPGYHDSRAGRVGQVNCCSTFPGYFAAGPSHPYLKGRPGINPLNLQYTMQVDRPLFERLRKLEPEINHRLAYDEYAGMDEAIGKKPPADRASFGETPVVPGDKLDVLTPPSKDDVARITEGLGIARNNARLVLATIHAHESKEKLEGPDPFLQPFARACIDAGADAFLLAGPHVLRGIEIYKGKPIFYCLGNFFFQLETMEPVPAEDFAAYGLDPRTLDANKFYSRITTYTKQRRFWESFLPVVTYEGDRVASIDLHPVRLGFEEPAHHRGLPRLAKGDEAVSILKRLVDLSRPYGTRIDISGGTGRVVLS
jgi:poly-gamma-glutamate synthesis protein (capsule biosynthesis protein)